MNRAHRPTGAGRPSGRQRTVAPRTLHGRSCRHARHHRRSQHLRRRQGEHPVRGEPRYPDQGHDHLTRCSPWSSASSQLRTRARSSGLHGASRLAKSAGQRTHSVVPHGIVDSPADRIRLKVVLPRSDDLLEQPNSSQLDTGQSLCSSWSRGSSRQGPPRPTQRHRPPIPQPSRSCRAESE